MKMNEFSCNICGRNFKDKDALDMHSNAKHPELVKKPLNIPFKKIRNWSIFIISIVIVFLVIISLIPEKNVKELNVDLTGKSIGIPDGAIHWHPSLTIIINGERISIPNDIGQGTGRIVDAHLSEMRMSPTNTHESDGTIHLENNNPGSKPETLTLGYFFYVWDKQFNVSCIFEYCTDKGELKMFVNDIENDEFENYIMNDKDNILIEYKNY